ncbi:hypothetical protein N665_0256s0024 [Sinapis alba]|nr:hypothetical protein N665_0256s0024 [Sinapis alba]
MKESQVLLSPPPPRQRDQDHADNSTTDIPHDLIVEILSLLPAKTLMRFQSVSKLWFSSIHTKYFVDTFLTIHYTTIADPVYYTMSRPVNGLICCIRDSSIAVCNPATRQIVKLPDVTLEDQYKVLCVMMKKFNSFRPHEQDIQQEHLVCTVTSSEKQEWRKINENTTIDSYRTVISGGMCIAGAIYYEVQHSRIVRFDVRSENIKLIKAPQESNFSRRFPCSLLNYNGKLGGVEYDYISNMRLWILEDAEKEELSSMKSVLPWELKRLLGSYVVTKGDVHTGELMVFYPWSWSSKPFCVWYYDFKKESIIRKVEVVVDGDFRRIHGTGYERKCQVRCYPGYFENIRFL